MQPPPSRNSPAELVLHIGTGKAGSSSIQMFLRDNRERLRELGYLYPQSPGRARHGQVGLFTKSPAELAEAPEWPRQKETDPGQFRRRFRRRLAAEVASSGLSRVILSDEVLFGSSEPAVRRLSGLSWRMCQTLRVVVYLRRQDDHMVSRYQQGVKIGWVRRLDDWANDDMTSLYDYHSRLLRHRRILSPSELVVRRFERGSFSGGSLYQDFLEAGRIDVRLDELVQPAQRNPSLDAESVEFLRLVNLHKVADEEATPGLIDNRQLVRRLIGSSSGPVLTLPDATLDRFMAQWESSNRAVASDFLGEPGEALFHERTTSRETTTEQRLAPERLDHFLDLAELPEQDRAPLRRLAEREASP